MRSLSADELAASAVGLLGVVFLVDLNAFGVVLLGGRVRVVH